MLLTLKSNSVTFQFNHDLSGDVIIYRNSTNESFEVPCMDLLEFISFYLPIESCERSNDH